MQKRFGAVALECLLDLGVTVVYAVLAGILIVGVAASDQGAISIMSATLYVLLLPGAAIALIVSEIGFRFYEEWRALRTVQVASPYAPEKTLSFGRPHSA